MTDTELKAKRASIKGRLTTFRNYLDEFKKLKQVSKAQLNEIKLRLRKIDLLFEDYDKIQTSVEVWESKIKVDGQPASEPDFTERENTERLFFCAISQAQELIAANEPRSSLAGGPDDDARSSHSGADAGGVRLPTIRLPTFDGSTSKWLEFRDVYISIVHNNESLSDICKFQYLKASLVGSAASVIESLEISAVNYTAAWKLVCDRFDNKRQLIHTHLKSLFNVSLLGREVDKSLRFLIDHVSKHLRALNSLGEKTDNWDTIIIFMFATKLDTATSTKWEEYRNSLAENPKLDHFYEFLRQRADVLEMISVTSACEKTEVKQNNYKRMDKVQKAFVATASDSSTSSHSNVTHARVCRVCEGDHLIYNCEKLNQMSVDERNTLIRKLKVCINCFRGGHFSHQCKANPCVVCKRKHNTLLHKTLTSSKEKDVEKIYASAPVSLSACVENEVLLSTAIVLIKNGTTNEFHEARCLLDNGAQSSFISEALMEKLGMQGEVIDTVSITGIQNMTCNVLKQCTVTIKTRNRSSKGPCIKVNAYVLSQIMKPLPSAEVDISNIVIPQNITLADPGWHIPSDIDLLVGGEIFWDLIKDGQIELGQYKPKLQNSIFGWLVVGNSKITVKDNKIKTTHCGFSREIRDQLSKFWELEEVPAAPVLTPEEQACEEHFKRNMRRLDDGRFCVTLPLKSEPDVLGDSYRLARKRFDSLEHRFRRQPDVKSQYIEFINEYAALNHLAERKKPEKAYFLPHHPILKEQSESTKCRVVFDASARTDSGCSLNDILMVGPTVQDDIFSILIRFRQHVFIFTGDIEKMYRQVIVEPSQRYLQMILWRADEGERIKYLALNTLTYGTSSAPFLSTRCLAQLGYECSDPLIKETILHDFYIDDLITGTDDETQLLNLYQGVSQTLSSAHFNLRKLKSNSNEFLSNVMEIGHNQQDNLRISNQSSTLGVEWNPNKDTILIKCTKLQTAENNLRYTKRVVLSVASSIFDPLGLLSACVILCKIFLQSLWSQKLDWDQEIPQAPNCIWTRFINSIQYLKEISIPRHASCRNAVEIQIHAFSDASLKAYAGCIYLRSADELGNCTVRLLCAKSKVAPLKTTTIPRLELCASLLVSRLCEKVVQALRCKIKRRYYWTDSKVVLGWLRIPTNKLCTFVSHRVAEINDKCSNTPWMYVPSAQNPSDLASRGVFPDEIQSLSLWWEGPAFLQDKIDQWPEQTEATETSLPELRVHAARIENPTAPIIDMANYSSFLKLRRIFAYVCRFVNCSLRKQNCKSNSSLTVDELEQAESKLAYLAQRESFLLFDRNLKSIDGSGKLNLFFDNAGLIRVGGRLHNSNYDFNKKHPVLLDAKHHFSKLLFRYYHFKLLHAPPQLLLSVIREHYWPINGRVLARRTYNDCTRCKRMKGEVAQQIMGNLPSQRITPGYAFEVVGTDFAGPFLVSNRKGRGAKLSKSYLCVFIDFKVKAVHLELVSSLSTEDFILALRRFISRRGMPREIFCDNGRNFVGASRAIGEFLKVASSSVSESFVDDKIVFHFSPAYAPNFGGLYEAAVRSAKFHIKRVVGNTHLTFEELTSLVAQIEAVLNSRPLYPMSSSPNDLTPLTPGHFLIGRALVSLPAPDLQEVNPNRLHRYARIEQARQHFWSRWSQEYICELQQRTRWQQRRPDIKPGQMVLIKDEATSPLKWPLGRIQAVYPGSDGASRVADILTIKGTIRRAINRICPFLDEEEDA